MSTEKVKILQKLTLKAVFIVPWGDFVARILADCPDLRYDGR
jgi:hypothetical protein